MRRLWSIDDRQLRILASKRLSVLEAEQRRENLLGSMEYNPRGTWQKLTIEEKQEREFLLRAVACGVFGDPWSKYRRFRRRPPVEFPVHLCEDRDAFRTYLKQNGFDSVISRIPSTLIDDKEVMCEVCRKDPPALRFASPRLKDDRDVVLAALLADSYWAPDQLEYASNRLKKDKSFILHLVQHHTKGGFMWLIYAELPLEDEREVALAVLEWLRKTKPTEEDSQEDLYFLQYSSPALQDDKDFMLQFVESDWRVLEFCSARLRNCKEVLSVATSQDPRALKCALRSNDGALLMKDQCIVLEYLKNGGCLDDVPSEMKSDTQLLQVALKENIIRFKDLPEKMQSERTFILAAAEADNPDDFYPLLSEHLQTDEELCLGILKRGYSSLSSIFNKVPSLYSSRDAVMAATNKNVNTFPRGLSEIIGQCPFRDDQELMLAACERHFDCLGHASDRLLSDRDFILTCLSWSIDSECLLYTSEEFQLNNIDIVAKAIECMKVDLSYRSADTLVSTVRLSDNVWCHRSVMMAAIKKGWSVLERLDSESPLRDDAELVRLAVKNSPSQLQYASANLRGDRDFILSLVSIDCRMLRHAEQWLWNDEGILVAATANSAEVIVDFFGSGSNDDFEHVVAFASRVRSRLELFDTFVRELLRGISIVAPDQAPASRCHLQLLDRGTETTVVFKKLIAGYLGVPIGAELHRLRNASANLKKLGF